MSIWFCQNHWKLDNIVKAFTFQRFFYSKREDFKIGVSSYCYVTAIGYLLLFIYFSFFIFNNLHYSVALELEISDK